ncbi:MAG: DUF192 domain-containing protein [Candidatus Brocadiae bacterium]|nr:DUF192 domain-containing protein [Candidatus Brocadiia bacterium]
MKKTAAVLAALWLGATALAGSLIAPLPPRSRLARDLVVFWEGSRQQERIRRPGNYELEFPSSYVKGQKVKLTVDVKREEKQPDGADQEHRDCTAQKARQWALEGSGVRVRFSDTVAQAPLRGFAEAQPPDGGSVPIGLAVGTANGPVCLIPADRSDLIELGGALLPGDTVSVRGRLLRSRTGQPCVLADGIRFAGSAEPRDEPPWTVSVRWAGRQVAEFSEAADYVLRLPYPNAPAAAEGVRLRLREFKVVDLTVGGHRVAAELADTQATRSWGLQGRRGLGPNEGMLFHFGQRLRPVFSTKTVSFPLSVAFILSDGTIVNIGQLTPGDRRSVTSAAPVNYVLEMEGGWFVKHGVAPGSKVVIP